MDTHTCNSCAYYHQHYALNQKRIFRIYCGHCAFAKFKIRRPYSPACHNYTPTMPDEDAFVSKEYLSKALLEYMMHLELLPQINDMEEK